ncbi:MAG: YetF domain-containing protein [Halanaerobiaceae bacterium]
MQFWEAQSALTIFQWMVRTGVTFIWLLFLTRLMGQRQVGRLTLFDFIIAIMIGSVAAGGLNNSRTNLIGVFASLTTLAVIDIFISFLSLKFSKFRRLIQGEPKVLIKNGKIIEKTLKNTRINLDDLLVGLRRNKLPNIADVEYAVLEPNGKISVIPKSQSRPLKPRDLNIDTNYEGYPIVVIEDGNILQDNLAENNLDTEWLEKELKKQGIHDENQVMAAILDTQGKLYVNKKNNI